MKKFVTLFLTLAMTACICSGCGAGSSLAAGDYVEFGDYTWQVLALDGNKAFIISERVIDEKQYDSSSENINWAESDIREYLNEDFYNSFSDKDKKKIVSVKLSNDDNPWDFSENGGEKKTDGCKDTKDKIFLLSIDEVAEYMGNDEFDMLDNPDAGKTAEYLEDGLAENRIAYNIMGRIAYIDEGSDWMLRSPGKDGSSIAYVNSIGRVSVAGADFSSDYAGVRPAMWVKKSALKKSEMICTDSECEACNNGIFTDTPVNEAQCPFCRYGYDSPCSDREVHYRLYHLWKETWVVDEEKIEEANRLWDGYVNAWLEFVRTVDEAGDIVTARIISDKISNRISDKYMSECQVLRNFYVYTIPQLDNEIQNIKNKTAIIKEANSVVRKAISDAPEFSVGAAASDIFGDFIFEVTRSTIKDIASEKSQTLWDSGYFHKIFGEDAVGDMTYEEFQEELENGIDGAFGESRIFTSGDGALDSYIEALILS
ncbi:MAG: hypothetical protein IJZ61_07760 [Oscillospiraceae bacterium]|nr:hypothetical protein [Oscillospiraceae bacterium]